MFGGFPGQKLLRHEAERVHVCDSAPSVYVQTIAAIQVVTIFDMGLKNITLYLSYGRWGTPHKKVRNGEHCHYFAESIPICN